MTIRLLLSKTPYELYKGRKPNVSHLRSFDCKCFILNNGKHPIDKMDAKSDEAIFMGYALNSKAYRVFNKTSLIIEESIHVIFYETNVASRKGVIANDDADIEDQVVEESKETKQEDSKDDPLLEDLQKKKINMMISPRLGSTLDIIPLIKS